jgi:predicted MFS family arabinose efflux permease
LKENNKIPLLYGKGDPLPLTMLIGLLQSFAIGFITLGIVYYGADRFGANSTTIGILVSVYTATYVVSCLLLSRFISRLKPYHALLISVTLLAVLSQVMLRVQSLSALMAIYLLYGVATGLLWPPLMGWMSRGRDGKQLNNAITAYNFSWSTAWIFSPYITGLLYERSPNLIFHMSSAFSLTVGIMILIYLFFIPQIKESAHSEHKLKKSHHIQEDKSTPIRFLAWIGLFPGYFIMGLVSSVFPLFLRRSFLLPESQVGLIILIRSVVTMVIFYIMGKTLRWHFNKKIIFLFSLVTAIALAIFSGSTSIFHYCLWTVLGGIIIGVTYTQSMFHSLSGAVERQKRMNIHEIVLTSGTLAGSLLGGLFLDKYSMNFIILFAAALTGLAFIAQLVVDRFICKK